MSRDNYNIGDHQLNQSNERTGFMGKPGGNIMVGEKSQNSKETIRKLIAYCKTYLPAIIIAFFMATIGTIFNIIGPDEVRKITDMITAGIQTGIDLAGIRKIALLLVGLYSLGFIFNYLQGYIMAAITQKVSKKLRKDISGKINRLPLKYFDSTSYGNVLSRVTNDVDTIGQTLNQSLGAVVTSAIALVGTLIMMLHTDVLLTAVAVASTLIGFLIMILIISGSQKYFSQQQQVLGKINGHIEEMYAGHSIVKVYNGEKEAKYIFNKMNENLYNCAWKSQFMSGLMMPLMSFVGNLGYVVVCVVGAVFVMKGTITFGVIVAFMMYIRSFTQPMSQLAQVATSLQSAVAAGERIFEFLEESELEDDSNKVQKLELVKGDVDFKNISFGYNENKVIIHDFSAKVKAGQKIAIVGPTGAGKTTIVNLLMKFYDIKSGEIIIDGVPTNKLTRENIHDLFCMVLQDAWLFEGTIMENIVFNKKEVSEQKVIEVCKAIGIDHFIRTLSNGYDTVIDDKLNFSAGQKQLLTIARAMVKDSPLLILDEATSSVDTRTEILIQKSMEKLMSGKTAFVIAHRLSTIKDADLILVMKDGDIIESGNHNELLAQNNFYAELYKSQFEQVS